MDKLTVKGSLLACIITIFTAPAAAVTIDYSNTSGSSINFDPTDGCNGGIVGCFNFTPPNNIQITSGSANGFAGGISGSFGVGNIISLGPLETASVTGTGSLSIFDGSDLLTATLNWVDIGTFGTAGSINTQGSANLTAITYTGSNADLVALASAGSGTQTATFQFTSPTSLTDLFTTSTLPTSTSFSGSISAVPVPAAVWLFGSGLLGMIAVARRRRD